MIKSYLKTIAAATLALCGLTATAQTLTDSEATATWPFDKGTEGQTATIAPEASAVYFKNAYASHGEGFSAVSSKSYNNSKQTLFTPATQDGGASLSNAVNFMLVPKNGLTFTPTEVSLVATRYGTDGGNIDISWVNPDGTTVSLASGEKPGRNKTADLTTFSYTVTGASVAEGECGLRVNIYNLGTTKQIGFADVVIKGKLNGTPIEVTQYSVTYSVNPEGAGKVTLSPVGSQFDENTELTLKQTRNFGYKFKNWTDGDGNELGTADALTHTLTKDIAITANYEAIPTYALTYSVDGGANDYMVTPTPAPTVIDGKNLYEENTEVTLAAQSNKILSFTGWDNGETTIETKLTMDKDQAIVGHYSAKDFIAAWDFYRRGGEGRIADFASADNESAALSLVNADGESSGWLDKSQEGAGGYEGQPAAVNWRTTGLGKYYWQTVVNAENFTDIKVASSMLLNYNAYSKQNVQYSLDGEDWTTIGTITLPGTKAWTEGEFDLPAAANNQSKVYIRWISDTTSEIIGAESANDGISISNIFITATAKIVDDGTAPTLVSTTPADGSTNASASGRIVLTFDEKVKVADGATATLGTETLTPTVYGKTVIFEYANLDYSTPYTFTLPANSVADLTDNYLGQPITLGFTTKTRPAVQKALYDFVVPDDGTFKEAIAAANKREDATKRFRIFVKQGDYTLPADETATVTGSDNVAYPSPITNLTASNVSIVGEDMALTTIVNTVPTNLVSTQYGDANPIEGLHKCQTLNIEKKVENTYLQDITLKNGLKDATGRGAALEDQGSKTVAKDVCLHGYQDTYLSNNSGGRFYFEGGKLRGRTDFLCGKGDVYYNDVELVMCEKGGFIAVPSTPTKYGYIFKDCTITGEDKDINGNYTLGRPWGSGTPIALFIDTRCDVQPSAIGWSEMSGGYPARFAEYNSTTASGSTIDLSGRKTTFGEGHINNPVLTADEAAAHSLETVMGGDDQWDPTSLTEQAPAPEDVKLSGNSLTWAASDYALLWAVCQDGKVVAFTTEPAYTVTDANASYSVRAANEMGGLGKAVEATSAETGITSASVASVAAKATYAINGVRVANGHKGLAIEVNTKADGTKSVAKTIRK